MSSEKLLTPTPALPCNFFPTLICPYTLPKFWRYNKVNLATSAFRQTLAHFTIYICDSDFADLCVWIHESCVNVISQTVISFSYKGVDVQRIKRNKQEKVGSGNIPITTCHVLVFCLLATLVMDSILTWPQDFSTSSTLTTLTRNS